MKSKKGISGIAWTIIIILIIVAILAVLIFTKVINLEAIREVDEMKKYDKMIASTCGDEDGICPEDCGVECKVKDPDC